ncbi:16566_t:CDS:2, partial [Racocetra fulgida]
INMHHIKSESVNSLTSQITSCSSTSSLNQTTTPLIVQISYLNPSEATDNYPQPLDNVSQTETPIVSYSGSFKDKLNSLKMQVMMLVDNCKFLNDTALQWFIRSLCKLNAQACGIQLNEEFQVAALADIIVSAVNYVSLSQIKNNERIQSQLLISLYHMIDNSEWISLRSSSGVYVEVQKIRLETLYKVLETSGRAGYSFTFGWNVILDIIKSVCVYTGSGETMENDAVSDDSLSILDESIFYISDTKSS